ncbi:MAG: YtxH domain-containing protein [Ilyomonas sp.]
MSVQKIIIAAAAGIAAGVAIGMLLAPYSGTETRQKIADSAEDVKDKIVDLSKKANIKVDDIRHAFTKEIEGLGGDVRQKILSLIDSGRNTLNRGTNKAADTMKEGVDEMAQA